MSITLFNKAVFSYYHFPYPNLVTTLQITVSLVYMAILARFKVMRFDRLSLDMAKQARLRALVQSWPVEQPALPGVWPHLCMRPQPELRSSPVQVFPLAFFWWLYVVSGVTALRFLTVPMYRRAPRARRGCLAAPAAPEPPG